MATTSRGELPLFIQVQDAQKAICIPSDCRSVNRGNHLQPCMAGLPALSLIEAHRTGTGCGVLKLGQELVQLDD